MRTQLARVVDLDDDSWRLPRVDPTGWLSRRPADASVIPGVVADPADPAGDPAPGPAPGGPVDRPAEAPVDHPHGGARRRPRRTAEARAARERELARRRRRRQRRTLVVERSAGPVGAAAPPGALSARRVVEPLDAPGYRIGRWGRLALTILVLGTMVLIGARVIAGLTVDAAPPVDVTVRPGDTLWSIAVEAAPDRDPRAVIEEIRGLNRVPGDVVHIGDVLRVPGSVDRGAAQ